MSFIIVIRYTDESKSFIFERLLSICTATSTKNETHFNIFLDVFKKSNLDWKNN